MAVTWDKLAFTKDVINNSLIDAAGDIIYGTANDTPAILSVGASVDGHILTLAGGVPSWAAAGAPGFHAATHKDAGADELLLHELGEPTGAVKINGQQLQNPIIHQVADSTALNALTPVVGKLAMQIDTLSPYICTSAA
jgi:hypothetical protein